jgi:tripartite-type tricarboxylate transporter receptor subunit TctC
MRLCTNVLKKEAVPKILQQPKILIISGGCMKISRKAFVLMVLLFTAGVLFANANREAAGGDWRPTKPITVIVPWGAGGSTDQVTRITAGELEKVLGQRLVIVNQPGASGSVGTKNVLDAAKDGYTWTAGAAVDLATYNTMGMLDTNIQNDWHIYLSVANVGIIGVNADSPYQTFDQLLADFKARPGQIGVATAGQSSSGHVNIELIRKYTGIEYKHVTYDGGNPAVTAVVAGEVMVTSQLAVEQADMIRGKKIRPLAVLADGDMNLNGYGIIPSIKKWIPDFQVGLNYFGIFIPKGVPQELISALDKIWAGNIVSNQAIKAYADDRGAVFGPVYGEAAQKMAFDYYQPVAWLYYEGGKAAKSPDTVGIPRP